MEELSFSEQIHLSPKFSPKEDFEGLENLEEVISREEKLLRQRKLVLSIRNQLALQCREMNQLEKQLKDFRQGKQYNSSPQKGYFDELNNKFPYKKSYQNTYAHSSCDFVSFRFIDDFPAFFVRKKQEPQDLDGDSSCLDFDLISQKHTVEDCDLSEGEFDDCHPSMIPVKPDLKSGRVGFSNEDGVIHQPLNKSNSPCAVTDQPNSVPKKNLFGSLKSLLSMPGPPKSLAIHRPASDQKYFSSPTFPFSRDSEFESNKQHSPHIKSQQPNDHSSNHNNLFCFPSCSPNKNGINTDKLSADPSNDSKTTKIKDTEKKKLDLIPVPENAEAFTSKESRSPARGARSAAPTGSFWPFGLIQPKSSPGRVVSIYETPMGEFEREIVSMLKDLGASNAFLELKIENESPHEQNSSTKNKEAPPQSPIRPDQNEITIINNPLDPNDHLLERNWSRVDDGISQLLIEGVSEVDNVNSLRGSSSGERGQSSAPNDSGANESSTFSNRWGSRSLPSDSDYSLSSSRRRKDPDYD